MFDNRLPKVAEAPSLLWCCEAAEAIGKNRTRLEGEWRKEVEKRLSRRGHWLALGPGVAGLSLLPCPSKGGFLTGHRAGPSGNDKVF
ncbi:hypothetical protein AGOR_G00133240 [Albula goreensis]|uniref:Uncharacterized protein n=1 Tax=Albula goreensis TaxID=1534307 RepID=A0A8T3DA17_9TELE|nr:hypothetical protein AGOR_G00133240 [Albula goreensis]